MNSTSVHTRGLETEVRIAYDSWEGPPNPSNPAALVFVVGGVMDVTIHCRSMSEIIDICDKLKAAIADTQVIGKIEREKHP